MTKPGDEGKGPGGGEAKPKSGSVKIPKKTAKKKAARKKGRQKPKRTKKDAAETVESAVPVKPPEEPPKPEKPQKPRERVREAMPGIINAIIKKAEKGSCQHFKSLVDQYPDAVSEDEQVKHESLAELLLEELKGEAEDGISDLRIQNSE